MTTPAPTPRRIKSVRFSPIVVAALMTAPSLLQGYSCSPATGDATLSLFEVEVGGQNQISAFDSENRTYNVWLPLSADTAIVRAYSTDPSSTVWYALYEHNIATGTLDTIDYDYFPTGGGEITLTGLLPEGRSQLYITVRAPGGAKILYAAIIQVGCSHCEDDGNECTSDACDPVAEQCVQTPVADGTACDFGGEIGTCVSGVCAMGFPCTEQGILDAIALGGGPHMFACNGPTTVVTQAEIVIDNDVILDGEGNLTIDGNDDHRVLSVVPGVTVELVGMTVSGGFLSVNWAQGAGIFNEGTLTLTNSVIASNGNPTWLLPEGVWLEGGGIYNSGTLTLQATTVQENDAHTGAGISNTGTATLMSSSVSKNGGDFQTSHYVYDGSGIYNSGMLTLLQSAVSLNGDGGGDAAAIDNHGNGTVTLVSSLVSDNLSSQSGAIVSLGTAVTLLNSTVSGNSFGAWSAIENFAGTVTLISSTVAPAGDYLATIGMHGGDLVMRNSLILADEDAYIGSCRLDSSTTATSEGGNIESGGDTCRLTDPTDAVNISLADLNLGPLVDNGGPTMTHALGAGSVAIDQIPEADCVDADGQPLTTDQRGEPRPETGGTMCDVGAFEVQP